MCACVDNILQFRLYMKVVSFALAIIHLPFLWEGVQFSQISFPVAILVLMLPKEKNSDRIQ